MHTTCTRQFYFVPRDLELCQICLCPFTFTVSTTCAIRYEVQNNAKVKYYSYSYITYTVNTIWHYYVKRIELYIIIALYKSIELFISITLISYVLQRRRGFNAYLWQMCIECFVNYGVTHTQNANSNKCKFSRKEVSSLKLVVFCLEESQLSCMCPSWLHQSTLLIQNVQVLAILLPAYAAATKQAVISVHSILNPIPN